VLCVGLSLIEHQRVIIRPVFVKTELLHRCKAGGFVASLIAFVQSSLCRLSLLVFFVYFA